MIYSKRFDQFYMDIAKRTAQMSYAERLQVGAVLVINNGIVATGYNGMPHGRENGCEHYVDDKLVTKKEVIHAERNVLTRVEERALSAVGGVMFITHAPCAKCALDMVAAGISAVVYGECYIDSKSAQHGNGIDVLRDHKVHVEKL